MLSHSSLGSNFWGEAISTAQYLLNLVPTKTYNKTPHELWTGRTPNLDNLRVWGCSAHILVPSHAKGKLESKTLKATFIGYPENSKGYRFFIHHDNGSINVIESRDARFLEEHIDTRNPNKLVELFEISKEHEVLHDVNDNNPSVEY